MFKCFYPCEYRNSTYEIPFEEYYEKGMRGIIFDIDNTLVEHGAPADSRAKKLIEQLKGMGFQIVLLSNNEEQRVRSFNDAVHVHYIHKAGKPGIKGYQKAMAEMKTNISNTMFVGDQIFTDVYGANRCGIYSILVKPIAKHEEIQIVLKRYLEKIVLFCYKHANKNK